MPFLLARPYTGGVLLCQQRPVRSGCKRVALGVKERRHEQVIETGAVGGSGNAVVGSAVVFRVGERITRVVDAQSIARGGQGSGEVPSVSCARAFLFAGDNFSCWGEFLVGYWRWL